MDILKINDNSLKLTLSADDMITYSLDCETIEHNRKHSLNALRDILRTAGKECGFSSEDSRFHVQLYASSKGDCEIYVKRISTEYSLVQSAYNKGVCVYSFEAMTPLLQACSRLRIARYSGDSTAYKEQEGQMYYLILEEHSPLPEEHGGRLCERNTAYYIKEHCKLICEGAVELLGRLI